MDQPAELIGKWVEIRAESEHRGKRGYVTKQGVWTGEPDEGMPGDKWYWVTVAGKEIGPFRAQLLAVVSDE